MLKYVYKAIFSRPALLRSALLGLLLALAVGGPALALPLFAEGDHSFEDHSWDDHSREDLHDIDLTGAILVGTDFDRSILTNSFLTGADLTDAILFRTVLTGSVLDGADLENADLRGVNMVGAVLTGADLTGVRWNGSSIFTDAIYDASTTLPAGFDTSGMILVPEPTTAAMIGLGIALLAFQRRR